MGGGKDYIVMRGSKFYQGQQKAPHYKNMFRKYIDKRGQEKITNLNRGKFRGEIETKEIKLRNIELGLVYS